MRAKGKLAATSHDWKTVLTNSHSNVSGFAIRRNEARAAAAAAVEAAGAEQAREQRRFADAVAARKEAPKEPRER